MGGCCIVNCSNSARKGFKMFRIPWNEDRKMKWAVAINRKSVNGKLWIPTLNNRVCEIHFVTGLPSKDIHHVDYVPSLYMSADSSNNCEIRTKSLGKKKVQYKMPACVAYGCYNRTDKRLQGTTFHNFPKDVCLKRMWISAINRKNWKPTIKSSLCSLHFTKDCFDHRMTALKERAVPTIFPEIPINLQQNAKETRKRKNNKQIISNDNIQEKESSLKKINFQDKEDNVNSDPQAAIAVRNFPNALCKKLEFFRKQSLFCDVVLKLNPSNKIYQVHSLVLAASSPFFEEILQFQSFEDCKKLILTLPCYVTCKGLEAILTFMYTGNFCIKLSTYEDIFQTAWLFKMNDIIEVCQKFSQVHKLPYDNIEVADDEVILLKDELTRESYQNICKEIDEANISLLSTEEYSETYIEAVTEENLIEEQNICSRDLSYNKIRLEENSVSDNQIIKMSENSVNSISCYKDSTDIQERHLTSKHQQPCKNVSNNNEINPFKKRKIFIRKNSMETLSKNINNIENNSVLSANSDVKSNLRISTSVISHNDDEQNVQIVSLSDTIKNTFSNIIGTNSCVTSEISQQYSPIKNLDNT